MGLSSRILLRICVPALALLIVMGALYHQRTQNQHLADAATQLEQSALNAAELIEMRLGDLDESLARHLEEFGQLAVPDQGGADALDVTPLAEHTLRLAQHDPLILGMEIHLADGTGLFAIVEDGQRSVPERAIAERWFAPALRDGVFMSWETGTTARYTRRSAPGAADPPLLLSALLDFEKLAQPAILLATHGAGPVHVAVACRNGETRLESGTTFDDEEVLVAKAILASCDGRLMLEQPTRFALAGLFGFERDALVIFGCLTALMGWMCWVGMRRTVITPLKDILQVVGAFEQGRPLPERPERVGGELAQFDAALRTAVAGFNESQERLHALNNSLEARVAERTEQLVQYAEQLATARDEARAASEAKGEFVANISHEIRTPLNGILGMTSLLADTPLRAEQQDYVRTVHTAGRNLLRIVNDTLDFSKAESGRIDLETAEMDLGQIVEEVADLLATSAHEKGLELHCDIDPELPARLAGDAVRVRQILTNLTGNAVKFTNAGEVIVRARLEERGREQARVRLEVRDTGIGLTEDMHHKVFDSFTQADSSTTRRFGGTGLGLAIAKRLTELMGGTIGVSSEPGSGSSFWCSLPFPVLSDANDVATSRADDALAGLAVVAASGRCSTRRILHRQLSAWGVQLAVTNTAGDALERARDAAQAGHGPDVLIVDESLPDAEGHALAARLQDDPLLARLPLVLLAQRGQDEARRAVGEGLATGLVHKPMRRRALRAALEDAAAESRPSAPARHGPQVAEPVVTTPASEQPARDPSRQRVLVAEDNPVNRKVAEHLLTRLGCRVDLVTNGVQAVEAAAREAYALVLMDCQMPEMDGYEATARIRRAALDGERVPILAVTAHAMSGDREKALACGMDDYLSKPLDPEQLRDRLDHWLPRGLPRLETPS
jgi:signal transduction histidine kinase/CheY-like chemotaxis protein